MISSFSMLGFRTLSRLLGILTQYDTSLYKIREYVSAPFQGGWGVLPVVPFENKIPTNTFSYPREVIGDSYALTFEKSDNWYCVSVPSRGEWGF